MLSRNPRTKGRESLRVFGGNAEDPVFSSQVFLPNADKSLIRRGDGPEPKPRGRPMKDFVVTIRFLGLTGEYTSQVEVKARNAESAKKKASKCIGNRDGEVVTVREG